MVKTYASPPVLWVGEVFRAPRLAVGGPLPDLSKEQYNLGKERWIQTAMAFTDKARYTTEI